MRKHQLALRVVMNSVVMILIIYLVMQVITYIRDNMLLGISDLSAMPGAVIGFMGSSVLPPMIVFGLLLYVLALPIQAVQRQIIAGQQLSEKTIEKTRRRILRFPRYVLAVNLIGFTVGFILQLITSNRISEFFLLSNQIVLFSNLAGGTVYAWAQSALNNLAFGPIQEHMGIHSIGQRKRQIRSTLKQVILGALLAFYVLSFNQLNSHDVMTFQDIELKVASQLATGELTPETAAEEWRSQLKASLGSFSLRHSLDFEALTLPWERSEKFSSVQERIFILYFILLVVIAIGIQMAISVDLRDQVRALQLRIRDVVTGGGDLRKRLSLRNMDDLGELTELINQLLDQFQNVVSRITAAAGQTRNGAAAVDTMLRQAEEISLKVGESVQELRSDLEVQAADSRKFKELLASFRAASASVNQESENQRQHVDLTSTAMAEMAQSIHSAEDRTREAGKLTEGLATQGQVGGKAMQETAQAINEIETAARQVLQVVGALNKIAAETNLLAMNAAIEAAHAGDHGTGFAVVADEVRKLSTNAAAQTQAIRELIKTMAQRVSQGVDRSRVSSEILNELVKGLRDSALVSAELAKSMDEQGQRSRSVSESLDRVVGSSESIRDRVQDQGHATERMSQTLESTLDRIAELVEASNRQADAVQGLNESFKAVRREVDQNTKAVDTLDGELSRFKI